MKITVEYEEDDGSFLNFDFNPFHMSNPKFIHRRIKSFGFAIQGVVTFCKTQPNGWIHLLGALFAIALGGNPFVTTNNSTLLHSSKNAA